MPFETITVIIAGIKTSIDLLKNLSKKEKSPESLQIISSIQSTQLSLQSDILSFQSEINSLQDKNRQLEQKLSEYENWEITENRYELKEIATGVFVYSKKKNSRITEPQHWVCAKCFQDRKKSILQCLNPIQVHKIFECQNCKSQINLSGGNPGAIDFGK